MTETKTLAIPTVGRIVHFYPPKPEHGDIPYTPVPKAAIVTASSPDDNRIGLTVFPNGEEPFALGTVSHESFATKTEPYWAWPEIK
ncbi:hypothetical protein QQ054_31965 [Oscillatoria amoena NRMC-F 0135]|nr:hypothetical protein [Oscillatoria amoena NRMC-F 0135]